MTDERHLSSELLACCVELCSQILRVPVQEVRTDLSFFSLGGSSITLMQFAAMLEAARPELFGPEGVDIVGLARAPALADIPGLILQVPQLASTPTIGGEL